MSWGYLERGHSKRNVLFGKEKKKSIKNDCHLCILYRKLEEEEKLKCAEVEELQDRVATLQAEKKTLFLEKNDLNAHIKHLESELQLARQANRCTCHLFNIQL